MVGLIPPTQRQQYIPPNQRAAIARRDRFGCVRRLWLMLPRISFRIPRALLNLARIRIKMPFLRPTNDDPAKSAELAWQELRATFANCQATMEPIRRSFGDPQQLKSMQDRLSVAGNLPPTAWIHDNVCQLLQAFLAGREELLDKLSAVAKEASSTVAKSRRLVSTYERSAKAHDHRSAWHAGYLQLAKDCHKEIESAEEIAKKAAARQAAFFHLIHEAQSIVRFFSELQLHRDRSAPFTHKPDAYRRQLVEGVSLCLRVVDTLVL